MTAHLENQTRIAIIQLTVFVMKTAQKMLTLTADKKNLETAEIMFVTAKKLLKAAETTAAEEVTKYAIEYRMDDVTQTALLHWT